MRDRPALRAACCLQLAHGVLLALLAGCAALPPNSFLDPTKVGRFAGESYEMNILRVLSPRDTPPGLANATEPTAEDLVPIFEDYRVLPGDTLTLAINDLIVPGQQWAAAMQVNHLGEIRIPELPTLRVTGLTEQELEQEITARLREADLLPRPVVRVDLQMKRGRVYTVVGAIGSAGTYPIPEPETRLLDTLGHFGDVSAMSKKMYIIRRASTATALPPTAPAAPRERADELLVPPPGEEPAPSFSTAAGRGGALAAAQPEREELGEALTPPPATGPARETEPAPKVWEPFVFDPQTGKVIEAERPTETVAPPAPERETVAPPRRAEELEEPFAWEDVGEFEFEQRIIAINIDELKNGNPRQNIVVRNRDVINVPVDTGVFYMLGEINRPGVYAFGGRDITIKQAITIAGGFGALAWPQRCEIIRREQGTDNQITTSVNLDAIFAGLEPDIYLRDDDIVNVGTHVVAPFLFVIRNSFRFTYGFGFVYDRNFADKDAYGGRLNPEIAEQQRRATRGLPF